MRSKQKKNLWDEYQIQKKFISYIKMKIENLESVKIQTENLESVKIQTENLESVFPRCLSHLMSRYNSIKKFT